MIDGSVVITGADLPLGSATARQLAADVDRFVLGGADADALATVQDRLAPDVTVEVLRTDPRDEFDVERLIETAVTDGHIGAVVPCHRVDLAVGAGVLGVDSYAAFDDRLRHDVRGVFATIEEAVGHAGPETAFVIPVRTVEQPTSVVDVAEMAIATMARALAHHYDGPATAVPVASFPTDDELADELGETVASRVRELARTAPA